MVKAIYTVNRLVYDAVIAIYPCQMISVRLLMLLCCYAIPYSLFAQSQALGDENLNEIEVVTVYGDLVGFGKGRATNAIQTEVIKDNIASHDVLNFANRLPGVNITQGDTFGGNDWSSRIYIRGMSTSREISQIGYMIDFVPNGNAVYLGGSKPNRFIDSENIQEIIVSQNAADISSASNEALGGTIRYKTDDPAREQQVILAYTLGDFALSRLFFRLDSGAFARGTNAYVSYSKTHSDVWIGEGNGDFDRWHLEAVVTHSFAKLFTRTRLSVNQRRENDYNSVTLAQFRKNNRWDGLLDHWSADPDLHTNYRKGWGADRDDILFYSDLILDYSRAEIRLTPYYHQQKGWGWWVPPYVVATVNGLPSGQRGANAYYEQQFTRDNNGFLIASDNDVSAYACLLGRYPDNKPGYQINAEFSCNKGIVNSTRRRSGYANDRYGITGQYELELENHVITAGAWWQQQDRDNTRKWFNILDEASGLFYDRSPYWQDFDRTYNTRTEKIYLQDQISFAQKQLQLTLGLVYHQLDNDYISRLEGEDVNRSSTIRRKMSQQEWLPKVNFLYQFSSGIETFISYAKNTRFIPEDALASGSSDHLSPEISDNWDLGLRWQGKTFAATGLLFVQDFNHRIGVLTPSGSEIFDENTSLLINIGGVRTKGIEWLLHKEWASGVSSFLSYSYTDSEYTRSSIADGIVKGNTLIMTPKNQFFAELAWKTQHLSNQVKISVNTKFVDKRYGTLDNAEQLEDYNLVNLLLSYEMKMKNNWLRFIASMNNVFNEHYLSANDGDQGGSYFIGAPRTFSFSISGRF